MFIRGFSVSGGGKEITIVTGVASSAGYIRSVRVSSRQGGRLYLDCCHAFGGINGRTGAEDTFTLPLDEDTAVIALYRGHGCYEEAPVKNGDGVRQRAENQPAPLS